jgi:hypothetical protein
MILSSIGQSRSTEMKLLSPGSKRAYGLGAAGLAALLISAAFSSAVAGINSAPAPLIGVMGPYGLLAAGVAYGGFRLFQRLKNRG